MEYRQSAWPHTSRHIRWLSVWGSLLFFSAAVTDYLGLGLGTKYYYLFAGRLLLPLLAVWPFMVARRPHFSPESDLSIFVPCAVASLVQAMVAYLWPEQADMHILGMVAMGLVFWLFVPVGLIYVIALSLILNTSFLWAFLVTRDIGEGVRVFNLAIVMVALNVLGFITLRKLRAARRSQYANTKQLLEAEENYRQVIENAVEGIVVVQDGRLALANPWIREKTGYDEDPLLGSSFEDYLNPAEKDSLLEYSHRRIEGGEVPQSYITSLLGADGRWLQVEVSGVVITWRGRPAILYFLADVSRRIKAQAEERELAKLQGVMEMAGAASHEVNQPLQILATLTALAKVEAPADSPVQARLTAMDEALERLRLLTHKIQRISRYETMDYLEETRRIIDIDKASK